MALIKFGGDVSEEDMPGRAMTDLSLRVDGEMTVTDIKESGGGGVIVRAHIRDSSREQAAVHPDKTGPFDTMFVMLSNDHDGDGEKLSVGFRSSSANAV